MGFALHPAPSTPPVVVGSLQYYRGMGCTSVSKSEKASNADLARFPLGRFRSELRTSGEGGRVGFRVANRNPTNLEQHAS